MFENWKVKKSELNEEEYSAVADWCNENKTHTIEDIGEYYAVVKITEPTAEEQAQYEIAELKKYLADTDYISNKLIEAVDDAEQRDLREKYAEVLKQRRQARVRINELEN